MVVATGGTTLAPALRMGAVARRSEHADAYQRRRPEDTALYEIVRDNLETLYGAIDVGALDVRIPKHAREELKVFVECEHARGSGTVAAPLRR